MYVSLWILIPAASLAALGLAVLIGFAIVLIDTGRGIGRGI